jgi:hypothetical protein
MRDPFPKAKIISVRCFDKHTTLTELSPLFLLEEGLLQPTMETNAISAIRPEKEIFILKSIF